MPKAQEEMIDALMKSKSFQDSYKRLSKTKKGFKAKFPTLRDYAWATSQKRFKSKKAAELEDIAAEIGEEFETDGRIQLLAAIKELDPESELAKKPAVRKHQDVPGRDIFVFEVANLGKKVNAQYGAMKLSAENAEKRWSALIGMPVHVDPLSGFSHHWRSREPFAIGSHIAVHVAETGEGKARVSVAAVMWTSDHREIVETLQDLKSKMGASYEILANHSKEGDVTWDGDVMVVNEYVPCGSALVRRMRAADPGLRLLAAEAPFGAEEDDTEEMTFLEAAKWSQAYKNDLPDSSFALVKKPVKNKARDRALPYKDKEGKISLDHVRNALARINQVKGFSSEQKAAAKKKLENILKKQPDKKAASAPNRTTEPGDPPNGAGQGSQPNRGQLTPGRRSGLDPREQLLARISDEDRDLCTSVLDTLMAEARQEAEQKAVLPLHQQLGELQAKCDGFEQEATRLKAQVEEIDRARIKAETEATFGTKMSELVAAGKIREEDKKEADPILRKVVAGEALTTDEAEKWGDLRAAANGGETLRTRAGMGVDGLPEGPTKISAETQKKSGDAYRKELQGQGMVPKEAK